MDQVSPAQIVRSLKNLRNPQVMVSPEAVSETVQQQIPEAWLSLIGLDDFDFGRLQNLWHPVVERMPRTFDELARTLYGLVLLTEDDQPPALLYVFLSEGALDYYRGFPPVKEDDIPPPISSFWHRLPADFRQLYTIHDGWALLYPMSLGHLPSHKLSLLSFEEWGFEPKIIQDMTVNPQRIAIVFRSGGSGYIGFELAESVEPDVARPLVFWSNKPAEPEFGQKFWPVFDAWVAIGLEQMDDLPC